MDKQQRLGVKKASVDKPISIICIALMGIFIAKISKGRTIRSLVLSCQDYMHSPFHTVPVRHTWDAERIIQMAQRGQF